MHEAASQGVLRGTWALPKGPVGLLLKLSDTTDHQQQRRRRRLLPAGRAASFVDSWVCGACGMHPLWSTVSGRGVPWQC